MKPLSQQQQENIQSKLLNRAIYIASPKEYTDSNLSNLLVRAGFEDDTNWNKNRLGEPNSLFLRLIAEEGSGIPFFTLFSSPYDRPLLTLQEALSILTMYDTGYKQSFHTFRGSQTGQEYQIDIRFNTQDSFDQLTSIEQEELLLGLDKIREEIKSIVPLVTLKNLPSGRLATVVKCPENYGITVNSLVLIKNKYLLLLTPQMEIVAFPFHLSQILTEVLVRPLEDAELKELSELIFSFIK